MKRGWLSVLLHPLTFFSRISLTLRFSLANVLPCSFPGEQSGDTVTLPSNVRTFLDTTAIRAAQPSENYFDVPACCFRCWNLNKRHGCLLAAHNARGNPSLWHPLTYACKYVSGSRTLVQLGNLGTFDSRRTIDLDGIFAIVEWYQGYTL